MAGKINSFLSFLKLVDEDDYDDDFYDDYEDDLEDERERRREEKRLEREKRKEEKRLAAASRESYIDDYEDEPIPAPKRNTARSSTSQSGKVVPIHSTAENVEVCIIKPANFGESQQVCEILLSGQPVVVNLEGIDILEAQRIMDFISGCIFSISGNMRQVSRYIFIFSPKNIDISGDYVKNVTADDGFNIPTLNKEF